MQVSPTSSGALEEPVELVEHQVAVVVDRNPAELDPTFGGQHVPGDDVGVVLHLGEDDRVTDAEVGGDPRSAPPG